jgi:xanthine dehydrogenase accessory factor
MGHDDCSRPDGVVGDWDRPNAAVLDRARVLLDADRRAVLATLVDVDGSAYRRPGAKRLVDPDGTDAGSLTPGCLSAAARRIAGDVLERGEPRTETFDLGGGESWGLGTGCDGTVEVLFEPLRADLRDPLAALERGDRCGVLTVLESGSPAVDVGDRAMIDGELTALRGAWPAWLRDRVSEATPDSGAGTVDVDGPDGAVTVFSDRLVPSPRLVVFGTGGDVEPIVDLATRAGFRVTVVGVRDGGATPERFPAAEAVLSASPGSLVEPVEDGAETYALLATHSAVDDRLALAELLDTAVPYVGVVGSRSRFESLLDALDRSVTAADRDRLYAPAGLDIGGDSPQQVALSVVSELLAVHNDRTPQHLRGRSGPIHDRP